MVSSVSIRKLRAIDSAAFQQGIIDIDMYQHSWDNLDELIFAIEQNLASAAGLGVILPSRENISMVDPALHGWLVKLGMQNDPTPGVEICTESNFSGHLTTMD